MKTLLNQNNLIFDPPPFDCVLYLPGLPGGSSTIHDRSPWGNHGSITGAAWKRLSNGLWYLSFDGSDDYAAIADKDSLDFSSGSFTVKLWLYLVGAYGDLIGKYHSAQAGRWGFSIKNATTIRFYSVAGQTELTVGNLANSWQSLTFLFNREDDKVYVYQQGCFPAGNSTKSQAFRFFNFT